MARRFTLKAIGGCPAQVVDNVVLLTSELVANAVVHAGTALELHIGMERDFLRITVTDFARPMPRVLSSGEFALHGRGLRMVAALSQRWGVASRTHGKAVWFTVGLLPPR